MALLGLIRGNGMSEEENIENMTKSFKLFLFLKK